MALSYISPGAAIDHLRMNTLWTEFERKMSLLLHGRSFLCSPASGPGHAGCGLYPGLRGKEFFFYVIAYPDYRQRTLYEEMYDHNVYAAAAAAAVVHDRDTERHIAWCNALEADLNQSLEAHTLDLDGDGTRWYIGVGDPANDPFCPRPERWHQYAVAEIICENYPRLVIPDNWNKYGCWRIHNLDPIINLKVQFDDHHELTIPPLTCRTVRRDAVDGTYEEGIYFWPYHKGDPTLWNAGLCASQFPERSMEANNVVNPSIIFKWIEALTSADIRTTFGWRPDPTVMYDLSTILAEQFRDVSAPQTMAGDVVIHQGRMIAAVTSGAGATFHESDWTGFASLNPAYPLTRTWNADGSLTLDKSVADPVDLITPGTNLLRNAGEHRVMAELPVTIPAQVGLALLRRKDTISQQEVTWSHVPLGRDDVLYGSAQVSVRGTPANDSVPIQLRTRMVTLRTEASNRDYAIHSSALTPEGPRIRFDRTLDYSLPGFSLPAYLEMVSPGLPKWADVISWGEQYWPAGVYPNTLWLSPRVHRHYGSLDGAEHSWVNLDLQGTDRSVDGADFTVSPAPIAGAEIRASVLHSLAFTATPPNPLPTVAWNWRNAFHYWWLPPDHLSSFLRSYADAAWWPLQRDKMLSTPPASGGSQSNGLNFYDRAEFLRVPMLAEHYNHMAWRVNQLTRCRPLCLDDLWWPDGDGNFIQIAENDEGMLDEGGNITTIRPLNQWCKIPSSSSYAKAVARLGLNLKHWADLPARWVQAANKCHEGGLQQVCTVQISRTYGTPVLDHTAYDDPVWGHIETWWFTVPVTDRFAGVRLSGTQESGLSWNTGLTFNYYLEQEYDWIDKNDATALANRLGVYICTAQIVRPVTVLIQEESAQPTLLPWSATEATQNLINGFYSTQADAQAAAAALAGQTEDVSRTVLQAAWSIRLRDAATLDETHMVYTPTAPANDDDGRQGMYVILDQRGLHLDKQTLDASTSLWTTTTPEPGAEVVELPMLRVWLQEGVSDAIRSADYAEYRTLAFMHWFADDVDIRSFALITPQWTVTRAPKWSLESLAQCQHVRQYGPTIGRPPTYRAPDPSDARVFSWGGDDAYITATSGYAYTVTPILEATLDLT